MMIRSFLPVGQGAFYCEKFTGLDEEINVIYDCGSLTRKSIVEQEISNNFNQGEIIHAVFLSHLDEDHMNGLPFLLKYCNVKKIFFPLLTEKNIKWMTLHNLVQYGNSNNFAYAFLVNPYEAIENLDIVNRPELIQIMDSDADSDNQGDFTRADVRRIPSGENVIGIIIQGIKSFGDWDKWKYIPHNFEQTARLIQLEAALLAEFGRAMTIDDLLNIWDQESERARIKHAYKAVTGKFNPNSMTLFSGETEMLFCQYMSIGGRGNRQCCCMHSRRSGCLYMGDYNASGTKEWNSITKAYAGCWDHIGCIQVPHHGSKQNFNNQLLSADAFFIISAGYNNRYRHPHAIVVKEILKNGHIPYIVTEHVGSAVYLQII